MKKFPYNLQKCFSASSLSGCIHRFVSKAIIAFPTQVEIVDLFERTLIGGFSCVNTRIVDSKNLLPKEDQKLICKIKNVQENIFEDKRVVMKILKMDENKQYAVAMTKPLPIGSIKKSERVPSLRDFDVIVQSISDEDRISHLFIVDTEFDWKNASQKQKFFNEIYTPIFKKKKVLPASERSVFQLLDTMRLKDKGLINNYKTTAKTHTALDKKYPVYAKHFHFLINRCGWWVTNIRSHYTFEQSKFKKEFVIMNQVSKQNAKTDVERDFYNVLNNSNFGCDCRDNADNCFFNPIYDEIEELSHAKKYQNIFDQIISDFVWFRNSWTSDRGRISKQNCCTRSPGRIFWGQKEFFRDPKKELNSVFSMKMSRKKTQEKLHQRHWPQNDGVRKLLKNEVYDWIRSFSCLRQKKKLCLEVKKNQTVATTIFSVEKNLMFAKLSLESFVHELA